MIASVLVFAALSVAAHAAERAPDARIQREGVTLDAYLTDNEVTFCFNAEKNVKIASEYGVEFKAPPAEAHFWKETLPKIVAGSDPYFELPVRIDLRTQGSPRARRISVGFGICVSATYCTPVVFDIAIPSNKRAMALSACPGETAVVQ
jgi:hypothetical protein